MQKLSPTNSANYKDVLGQFCTGITVITSVHDYEPVGFTCQSFSAVAMTPPLILLCPQKSSTSWPRIRKTGTFVVNILAAEQRGISDSFARSSTDKFAGVKYSSTSRGLPVLDGSLAWIECEVTEEIDAGDHTIVVGEISEFGRGITSKPLLFHRGNYLDLSLKEPQSL